MKLTDTKITILKEILADINKPTSIRGISEKTKIQYKQVHTSIKNLVENKVLTTLSISNALIAKPNIVQNIELFSYIERLRFEDFLKENPKLKFIISKLFEEFANIPYITLIIFGSYASGKAKASSDLDIAMITNKENLVECKNKIDRISSLVNIKLHSIEFTPPDFKKMLENKENINVGTELLKNHIILNGGENYYRIVAGSQWSRILMEN